MEAIFYTHCQQSQPDAKKALLPLWASSGEGFPLLRVYDPSHGHAEVKLYTRTESFTCFLHLTSLLQVLSPHLRSSERKVHMSGQWPLARGKVLEKWLTVFALEMPVILAIFSICLLHLKSPAVWNNGNDTSVIIISICQLQNAPQTSGNLTPAPTLSEVVQDGAQAKCSARPGTSPKSSRLKKSIGPNNEEPETWTVERKGRWETREDNFKLKGKRDLGRQLSW